MSGIIIPVEGPRTSNHTLGVNTCCWGFARIQNCLISCPDFPDSFCSSTSRMVTDYWHLFLSILCLHMQTYTYCPSERPQDSLTIRKWGSWTVRAGGGHRWVVQAPDTQVEGGLLWPQSRFPVQSVCIKYAPLRPLQTKYIKYKNNVYVWMTWRCGCKRWEVILFKLRFVWTHEDPREGGGKEEKGVQEAGCLRAGVVRRALYPRLGNGLHGCSVLTGHSAPSDYALKTHSIRTLFKAYRVTFFHSYSASAPLTKPGQNLCWPREST